MVMWVESIMKFCGKGKLEVYLTNLAEVFALVMLMLIHQLHVRPTNSHSTTDTVSIFPVQFQFLVRLHIAIEVYVVLALPTTITLVLTIREAMEMGKTFNWLKITKVSAQVEIDYL